MARPVNRKGAAHKHANRCAAQQARREREREERRQGVSSPAPSVTPAVRQRSPSPEDSQQQPPPAERRARDSPASSAPSPAPNPAPVAEVEGGDDGEGEDDSSFRRDFNAAVYDCVRRIPEGKVCSYGQIAKLIDHPRHSRMVGAALKVLPRRLSLPFLPPSPSASASASLSTSLSSPEPEPEPEPNPDWVPWHRVVSSSGLISPRGNPAATARQAEWLEAEGVVVRSGPGVGAAGGRGGGADGGGREQGDAFGLGARVEGGGRVSMASYAWMG